jgi:hypothetical protein
VQAEFDDRPMTAQDFRFGRKGARLSREVRMIPIDKATRKEKDAAMVPDDPRPDWVAEDNEIDGRKPDLGEIEEDTEELDS